MFILQNGYGLLKNIHEKIINYYKAFRIAISGHPLIIKRSGKVYKITLQPTSVKQLNKEVHNTELASERDIFEDRVVVLERIAPFAVRSSLIKEDESKSRKEIFIQKQRKLIKICIKNEDHALKASRKPAFAVINSQINNLKIGLKKSNKILYSQFNALFCNYYFKYPVPVTLMHGDFSPSNTLIKEKKLFIIDWEYALTGGSIIYDWWYLKFCINSQKLYNNDTEAYFSFLVKYLEKIDLRYDQFNAFGYAMYSVIELSRLGTRKSADMRRIKTYLNELDSIINDNQAENRLN